MSGGAFDQKLANAIVKVLARTPVTPNMVTTFGLATGVAAAYFFATGDDVLRHWAALIFMWAVFNDHLDGQLARATGRTSKFGHYYDHFAVAVTYVGMFVGAGIGFAASWLGPWAPVLGIAAGLSVTAIFATRMTVEARTGGSEVRQNAYWGFEVEDTLYIVGPVTWLGLLEPFLVAAGVGAPLFLIWVVARSRRHLSAVAEVGQDR